MKEIVYNKSSNEDDAYLCRRARQGDQAAEEALLHRYTRLVRAQARPYFLYGGDFEDLLQEGMLGLLSAVREYDESRETSFRRYAEVCVKRRVFSAIRTASREKNAPLNYSVPLEEQPEETALLADGAGTPEELVLGEEQYRELSQAIYGLLSTMEVQVLDLYLQGLSYSEIGQITGKGAKAADNAVQRIRKKVARYLSTRR